MKRKPVAMICVHYLAIVVIVAPVPALPDDLDAKEIIRRAVAADERNWKLARNYGFSERVDARRLDSGGRVKSRDVSTYDVLLVEGSPYRRLAGRQDRRLAPADEMKEQAKLAKNIAEREKETAAQRARRLNDYESRPEWLREAWRELPEVFDFRIAEESDALYVIDAQPHRGYQPRSRTGEVLTRLHGRLWVDKKDYQLFKAEVQAVDIISVGLFVVRLAKGSRAAFEQTKVNDEVWLPQRVYILVSARLGLLKSLNIEHEVVYTLHCNTDYGGDLARATQSN